MRIRFLFTSDLAVLELSAGSLCTFVEKSGRTRRPSHSRVYANVFNFVLSVRSAMIVAPVLDSLGYSFDLYDAV